MEFLSQQKIPFVEKDVTTDEKAAEELMALGSMSTPTIVVDGTMIVGFNPQRLLQLIKAFPDRKQPLPGEMRGDQFGHLRLPARRLHAC